MKHEYTDKLGRYGLTASEVKNRSVTLPHFGVLDWKGAENEEAALIVAGLFASGVIGDLMRLGVGETEIGEAYSKGVKRRLSALATDVQASDRRKMRDIGERLTGAVIEAVYEGEKETQQRG